MSKTNARRKEKSWGVLPSILSFFSFFFHRFNESMNPSKLYSSSYSFSSHRASRKSLKNVCRVLLFSIERLAVVEHYDLPVNDFLYLWLRKRVIYLFLWIKNNSMSTGFNIKQRARRGTGHEPGYLRVRNDNLVWFWVADREAHSLLIFEGGMVKLACEVLLMPRHL